MKSPIYLIVFFLLFTAMVHANESTEISVFEPEKGQFPVHFPEKERSHFISKFGKGSYRIDSVDSHGQLNCLFIYFEAAGDSPAPEKPDWKKSTVESDGKKVLRSEARVANPKMKEGHPETAVLRLKVDALDEKISREWVDLAEYILKHATD